MNDTALMKLLLAEKAPEELEVLRMKAMTQQVGEYLHTICCGKNHETECDFYLDAVSFDVGKAREEWTKKAEALLTDAGITSAERTAELLRLLPYAISAVARSADLLSFLIGLLPNLPLRDPKRGGPSCVAFCPSKTVESP